MDFRLPLSSIGNAFGAAERFNVKGEGGQNHQMVHKDQKIDEQNQDKVLGPQFDR